MNRDSRLEDLFTAARMYYGQSRTMEAIAGELEVSRSTVSRMLRDAREAGLVRITLRPPDAHRVEDLARRISRQYGVTVHVVPAPPEGDQRDRLAAVVETAAELLDRMLEPGTTLGVAWGTTVAALLGAVRPRPVPGLRIVQLNGAINVEGSGLTYIATVLARAADRWDATVHQFPVPAFFDYAATREAMWHERSRSGCWRPSRRPRSPCSAWAPRRRVPATSTPTTTSPPRTCARRADGAVGDVYRLPAPTAPSATSP